MKIINHTKTHHCFLNSFKNIRLSRRLYKLHKKKIYIDLRKFDSFTVKKV